MAKPVQIPLAITVFCDCSLCLIFVSMFLKITKGFQAERRFQEICAHRPANRFYCEGGWRNPSRNTWRVRSKSQPAPPWWCCVTWLDYWIVKQSQCIWINWRTERERIKRYAKKLLWAFSLVLKMYNKKIIKFFCHRFFLARLSQRFWTTTPIVQLIKN